MSGTNHVLTGGQKNEAPSERARAHPRAANGINQYSPERAAAWRPEEAVMGFARTPEILPSLPWTWLFEVRSLVPTDSREWTKVGSIALGARGGFTFQGQAGFPGAVRLRTVSPERTSEVVSCCSVTSRLGDFGQVAKPL